MSEEYREEKSASANFIGMLLEKIYDFEKKCHEVETNNNEIKLVSFTCGIEHKVCSMKTQPLESLPTAQVGAN